MNRWLISGIAACLIAAPGHAQETTATIRGMVAAEQGPVANAAITIEHLPSGTRSRTRTGKDGGFIASGLRTGGPFTVTVEAPGFEQYRISGIALAVGAPLRLPVRLAAQQELLVTADTIRTTWIGGGVAMRWSADGIAGIASPDRALGDIAWRDPFVAFDRGRDGPIGIAGQDPRLARLSVDGIRLPGGSTPVSLDAIADLAVKAAPYDVAEGDARGGAIDLVLRSGANRFAGSGFASFGGDGLAGNTSRGRTIDRDFDSRQAGGFLSGPIARDRLFFALSYERLSEDRAARDEKYAARVDWNVSGRQRAAFTYLHDDWRYAAEPGGKIDAGAIQLDSDWADDVSTRTRLTYARSESATLASETIGGEVALRWRRGAHALKGILGYRRVSLEPPAAGQARLTLATAALEDGWTVTRALTLTAGARLDAIRSRPNAAAGALLARSAYGGREAFQPRFALTWQPKKRLVVRGGIGRFADGLPDPAVRLPAPDAAEPGLDLPSAWKSNLSVDYTMDLGPFGDGWRLGGDLYYAADDKAPRLIDRSLLPAGLLPDGRTLYAAADQGPDGRYLLSQTGKGRSMIAVARVGTEWAIGLAANLSYTFEDAKDVDPLTGLYGRSPYEIRHAVKFALDYDHRIFGDNRTRISLFGEWRSGRPYSLTMVDDGGSPVFGTPDGRGLLYVPDLRAIDADPRVAYDGPATFAALKAFVANRGLEPGIVARNGERAPDALRIDLHLDQEIPMPLLARGRMRLFADLRNVLNLIDDRWGSLREAGPVASPVRIQCLQSPGSPAAPLGAPCVRYLYSGFQDSALVTDERLSLWALRIGARVEF